MNELFKVIYAGGLKPDVRAEEAIDRLASAFDLSPDDARTLVLGGQRHVLKKDIDRATAERYLASLGEAGLLARIEPMEPPKAVFTLEPIDEPENRVISSPGVIASGEGGGRDRSGTAASPPPPPPVDPPPQSFRSHPDPEPSGGPDPSAVPAGHGWDWVLDGFRYFRANPGAWILAVLALLAVSVVVSLVPFVGGFVVSVLATLFTGGLMLGVREQHEGRPFRVEHLFAGFSNNPGQLGLVAVLYLAGTLAIGILMAAGMLLAAGPMLSTLQPGTMPPGDPAALFGLMGPAMLLPILLGALFLIPLMMAYFFAPALVVLDRLSATAAMRLSFMGCLKNIVPFLIYGLVGLVLVVLGAIPFGLGLLVVTPVLAASIYAAYRDIYHGEGRLAG
jgi:hypothetical protein